jgi:hypothetical protein
MLVTGGPEAMDHDVRWERSVAEGVPLSKTVPVIFGDTMFWAYDVALGVLFIEAAQVCAETPPDLQAAWRPELEQDLRTHALVGSSFAVLPDEFGV